LTIGDEERTEFYETDTNTAKNAKISSILVKFRFQFEIVLETILDSAQLDQHGLLGLPDLQGVRRKREKD
jgi:hypothetical protein